jgi:hypothetical protein
VEVRQELVEYLTATQPDDLQASICHEMQELFTPLHCANDRVFKLVVQELEFDERRVLTSGARQWRLEDSTWVDWPHTIIMTGVFIRPGYNLDPGWRDHIQVILNLREEPFVAFEHLHEAWRDRYTRSAWIDATIAAELAIKEALARLEPKLVSLLFEVPSPPLRKLYGKILEEVTGERSPYVKQLHEGAELRNKLIHRPEAVRLDPQDVVNYVSIVNRSIWHLISLCRREAIPRLHRSAQLRGRPDVRS